MADEVEIFITVQSDEAVAGVEKVKRELQSLERQAGETEQADHKRSKLSQADLKAEHEGYTKAVQIQEKYAKQIDKIIEKTNKLDSQVKERNKKGQFTGQNVLNPEIVKYANQIKKLEERQRQEILATTGISLDGWKKRSAALRQYELDAKGAEDRIARVQRNNEEIRAKAASNWQRMLGQAYARQESLERAAAAQQQRTLGARMEADRKWVFNQSKMRNDAYKEDEKFTRRRVALHASANDENDRRDQRSAAEAERVAARIERAFNGGSGGGRRRGSGGGGVRRSQFANNGIIDTGGRGIQPRNLAMGSAIGLGAIAAGPVGYAAAGLAGAIPGAILGLGSAIAAIKMSGLTQVAGQATRIRDLQAQISTGAIKEAKGRAEIAAILKQMSPEQKKALEMWKGFYAVTQEIGNQVSDKMLPAFGMIGKALEANKGTITTSVVGAGKAMAGLITTISRFTMSGVGKKLFGGAMESGNTFIDGLTKSLGDLGKSFFAVGNSSQGFMKKIMGGLNNQTGQFAKYTTSKGGQKDLDTFFKGAGQEVPRVLGLVEDLGKVLITVFKAALPFADRFIDSLDSMLQHLNKFLQSARGQADMKRMFEGLATAVKDIVKGAQMLWTAFNKVSQILGPIAKGMINAFGPGVTGIILGLSVAVLKFGSAGVKAVTNVWDVMKLLGKTNPWVAATVGVVAFGVIAIKAMSSLKTEMGQLRDAAHDTSASIRGVFQAIQNKASDKKDIPLLDARRGLARDAVYSQKQKIYGLQQQLGDAKPGSNNARQLANEIKAANVALLQLQSNYRDAVGASAQARAAQVADAKKITEGIQKTASNVQKAFGAALRSTQKQPGWKGALLGSKTDQLSSAPDLAKASAAFKKVFMQMGENADGAGARTKAAINWIAKFVSANNKIPNKKQISFIIHDLASRPIQVIKDRLAGVRNKAVKVTAPGATGVLATIEAIANTKISDKQFKVIGTIINPTVGPLGVTTTPVQPVKKQPSVGGVLPGMGAGDSIPAMLQPGEVVLNRNQQYDFGGPEVFKNYFGSGSIPQHYKSGGLVHGRIIGDSPTSGLGKNAKGKIIMGVGLGDPTPTNTNVNTSSGIDIGSLPTDAEPDMKGVLEQLRNKSPEIAMWTRLKQQHTIEYNAMQNNVLYNDKKKLSDLYGKKENYPNTKGYTKSKGYLELLGQIRKQSNVVRDHQKVSRYFYNQKSIAGHNLTTAKKVYEHIPGYTDYENQQFASDAVQKRIAIEAATLPMLDPNADPNAQNGMTFLTAAYKRLNGQYAGEEAASEGSINARIDWLTRLMPGLKGRPKYQSLAAHELSDDRSDLLATMGRSLADALPSGVGPGSDITDLFDPTKTGGSGSGSDATPTWADQDATKSYMMQMAQDSADAAYALITNDATKWTNAMSDERDTTWTRIQQLQGAKDFGPFAAFRGDILDEITSDSGTYTSVIQAIQAGFAAAQGSDSSNDSHVQDVIDAANTLMGQINVGTTVEREQLGLLTDYLRGQAPSFEVGTNFVGKSGLAQVHYGETITPRGDVRSGGHPGGTLTIEGSDKFTRMIADHITYTQGQSSRRKARERRR